MGDSRLVVVDGVRGNAVGNDSEQKVIEALQRFVGIACVVLASDDQTALDTACSRVAAWLRRPLHQLRGLRSPIWPHRCSACARAFAAVVLAMLTFVA